MLECLLGPICEFAFELLCEGLVIGLREFLKEKGAGCSLVR
jgi:hypothetical protein